MISDDLEDVEKVSFADPSESLVVSQAIRRTSVKSSGGSVPGKARGERAGPLAATKRASPCVGSTMAR